jgi:hypothetical protein
MKTISTLAVVAMMGLATSLAFAVPAQAASPDNTDMWVSPVCEKAETKEAHPGWYNTGGYCNPFDYDD